MENPNKKTKEVFFSHPLEDLFGIEPGSTVGEVLSIETPMIEADQYDNKDIEIEKQFQEIYDMSLTQYENLVEDIEQIDPKYRARTGEISVQFLNTALSAAKEKASLKQFKDKQKIPSKQDTNTTNNNLIVADRNDILKMLIDKNIK